jgi:hypothetical protein
MMGNFAPFSYLVNLNLRNLTMTHKKVIFLPTKKFNIFARSATANTFSFNKSSATTITITTPNIMTLSVKGKSKTLSIRDSRHERHSITTFYNYAENIKDSITTFYNYAECRVLFVVMQSVVMLNVIMLNVLAP